MIQAVASWLRLGRFRNNFVFQWTGILLAISLLPILILFFVSQETTQRAMLQVASQNNMQMLGNQREYLSLQMDQIDALAANLGQVEEISNTLARSNALSPVDHFEGLATKARIGYLLSNYRNLKGLVSIDLFSLSGTHYHVGDTLNLADERHDLRDSLMERTLKASTSVVWHGVEDNVQQSSSAKKVLVATKLLMKPDSSWLKAEPVGMLVVNYSTDYLYEHFNAVNLGKGGYLLVVDEQRRLIYAPNRSRIGATLPGAFARVIEGESGSSLQQVDQQEVLLSYQKLAGRNWYVISLVPKSSLLSSMADIERAGWLMLAISMALVILFVRALVKRVVEPMAEISDGFRRFQTGQLVPGWRLEAPQSLQQVTDLVRWFNAFLENMEHRREADTRLRIAATAFESQEGMFVTDHRNIILQVNSAFSRITGYSAEEAIGQSPSLLRSGAHDEDFYTAMRLSLTDHGTWSGEILNRRKDGSVFPDWLTVTAVKNEEGVTTHYVATMTDITQRKANEEEIRNLAFYDPLTLLPNRRLLTDRLKLAIISAARHKRCGALMFLDLDKFKFINDSMGHAVGDLLLVQVARRLTACVREGDTVGRLGGDEFVVLLEGLVTSVAEAAMHAEVIGLKIIEALHSPYELEGRLYQGSASLGITVFRDSKFNMEELMQQADIALYQAKDSGRNTMRFFDPEMQAAVLARVGLEHDMQRALEQQQFVIHLQPQFDAQFRPRSAEALVRWQHPQKGLVMPNDFISLAEDSGLIVPLGMAVLQAGCRVLARWASLPERANWTLSVNVSARQFRQSDFVAQVLGALQHTGANPCQLRLEVTESLLIADYEVVVTKMNELQSHGVSFSLDDFGTGYSSLSYLKRLPLAEVKIDRSFVTDVMDNQNDAAIVRAIISLAEKLNFDVVAEGVETREQMEFPSENGCRYFQGYLLSPPITEAEFELLVASPPDR